MMLQLVEYLSRKSSGSKSVFQFHRKIVLMAQIWCYASYVYRIL
jgi:hypothetical protein